MLILQKHYTMTVTFDYNIYLVVSLIMCVASVTIALVAYANALQKLYNSLKYLVLVCFITFLATAYNCNNNNLVKNSNYNKNLFSNNKIEILKSAAVQLIQYVVAFKNNK
jgi:hypothetical protein